MPTPESKVKEMVRKVLKAYDAYWHCPVMNGLGAPSLDFVGCYYSEYFAIETKAPGKKMTPRQLMTKGQIEARHGRVFLIDGDTRELEEWLYCVKLGWTADHAHHPQP